MINKNINHAMKLIKHQKNHQKVDVIEIDDSDEFSNSNTNAYSEINFLINELKNKNEQIKSESNNYYKELNI